MTLRYVVRRAGRRRWSRPSHANVRSTTQRRGSSSQPLVVSDRLMISIVHLPMLRSASLSFSPAYRPLFVSNLVGLVAGLDRADCGICERHLGAFHFGRCEQAPALGPRNRPAMGELWRSLAVKPALFMADFWGFCNYSRALANRVMVPLR